jgi:hypothetical protein
VWFIAKFLQIFLWSIVTFPTFSSEVFFYRVKINQKEELENILSNFPF